MDTDENTVVEQGDEHNDLVMEDVPEMHDDELITGLQFSESTDDLLEDGECQVQEENDVLVPEEENTENEGQENDVEINCVLKGKSPDSEILPIDIDLVNKE